MFETSFCIGQDEPIDDSADQGCSNIYGNLLHRGHYECPFNIGLPELNSVMS